MDGIIENAIRAEGIEYFAPIPLSDCEIKRAYLLERAGISDGTAIMLVMPYCAFFPEKRNISLYATPRDYHIFFKGFSARVTKKLAEAFPNNKFAGFADHSPIAEIKAAAEAGLGVIGKNGLLITEKYSSLVFIGEIVTDMKIECRAGEIKHCEDCGACLRACPGFKDGKFEFCLSEISQRKGELTEEELKMLRENGTAWGCDICQLACPHTKRAIKEGQFTRIKFFRENLTPFLTSSDVKNMTDAEFAERAYSWRGRAVITRNLENLEKEPTEK